MMQYFLFKGENNQLFYLEKSGEKTDRNKTKDKPNKYTLKTIDLTNAVTEDDK